MVLREAQAFTFPPTDRACQSVGVKTKICIGSSSEIHEKNLRGSERNNKLDGEAAGDCQPWHRQGFTHRFASCRRTSGSTLCRLYRVCGGGNTQPKIPMYPIPCSLSRHDILGRGGLERPPV